MNRPGKGFLCAVLTGLILCLAQSTHAAEEAVKEQEEGQEQESTEAEQSSRAARDETVLGRITVASTAEEALRTPGSAYVLDQETLAKQQFGVDDIQRALRQIPGTNTQDEEGYGLRPNIGFRGVPNERSAKITVMEDSVLIAPAPYAAPSAYYFPPIGRMEGLEVTKGPGQIKYGPYTTGGALNMFSTSIPEETNVYAKVGLGNDNLRKAHIYGGDSFKYGGILLETYQFVTDGFKDLDGGGDTGYDLEDYQIKGRLNTDPDSKYYNELQYKFGYYDQVADETYLGLTDEDFGKDPFRRYAASQLDSIDADHIQHHLRYFADFDGQFDVTTTLYYNETQRNWYKLQSVGGTGIGSILDDPDSFGTELGWIRGETDSPDDSLAIRANQRDYESMGVQTVVHSTFELGPTQHEIEVGARFHSDEEDRFQHEDDFKIENGTMVLTTGGAPGSQANRIGSADAWAFYIQDEIIVDDFLLLPGLRYENINYTREDYGKSDPDRTGEDLKRVDNDIDELIPGISVQHQTTEELAIFVGVHKGFSPPGPAGNDEVESEESINYEAGASFEKGSLNSKFVFFYNDYDNLLGADTLSSGGEGTGDLFNGGEVDVLGVEFSVGYNLLEAAETELALPTRVSYTYTDAEFKDDFDSDFFGEVSSGDQVPYIPEHQFYGSIGAEYDAFRVIFEGYFSDSMKTAAGEADFADRTDSYMVFDLLANWQLSKNVSFFANVENLFDREYVVARRPAGARPGLPLTVVGGVELVY